MSHTETEYALVASNYCGLWRQESGSRCGGLSWEALALVQNLGRKKRQSGATFCKWRQSPPTSRGLNSIGGFGHKEVTGGRKAHPQGALWPMAT